MRAFKFSLQKLLDTKDALEKQGETRMGAQLRALAALKGDREELKGRIRREVGRTEAAMTAAQTDRHDLSVRFRYLASLHHRCEERTVRIAECEKGVEELREELLGIMRERKTLERLREQERQEWRVDTMRAEQGEMDAVAASGHFRKRRIA